MKTVFHRLRSLAEKMHGLRRDLPPGLALAPPLTAVALALALAASLTTSAQEADPTLAPPAGEVSPAPAAGSEAWVADVEQAIKELSADDFRTREAATLKLWKIGEKAEPYVREAAESGSIEVRTRTKRMLTLFKYGIYPETPAEIIAIINQFRHGSISDKTAAIQRIYALGAMGTVAKLIRSIEDQATRKTLVRSVVDELDEKLNNMFADEKYDEVGELLKLAAISDEGLRDLAAFHLQRGTIDAEIDLVTGKDEPLAPIEYEQLSWLLRLKGDLDGALDAAKQAGRDNLERDIRIAQGDLLALIKASYNANDRTIQAYGFTAAVQRLSGDSGGFEKTIQTIKRYAAENTKEEYHCLKALLINGRLDDAIEISAPGGISRVQLLVDNGYHARALAELGIDDPRPPYDGWTDDLCKKFAAATEDKEHYNILERAYTISRLLLGWGEDAEAKRIYDRLGAIGIDKDLEFTRRMIANASLLDLHEVALKYSRAALKKEAVEAAAGPGLLELKGIDLDEENVRARVGLRSTEGSIINSLYYNISSLGNYWWDYFEEHFGDESALERLERIETLLAPLPEGTVQRDSAIALLGEILQIPDDAPDAPEHAEGRVPLLTHAAETYLLHGDRASAMELYEQALKLNGPNELYTAIAYAELLGKEGKWEDAARYYKQAMDAAPGNPPLLILQGLALERAGKNDEAAAAIKRGRLQALGRPLVIMRISAAFAEFDEFERAQESSQIALNIAGIDDTIVYRESIRLADYLLHKDDERAAMYKERYLIEHLKSHVSFRRLANAPSIRAAIGIIETRQAIAAGRTDKAVKIVHDLTTSQPSNSSILEELYPILVQAGRRKEADEAYDRLNRHGTAAIGLFPNSAQDLNSLAWLKARCGKDLDNALKLSERSNQLSVDNYAYLDTLAEVHFQRGDRSRAIGLSEKAVALSSGDFLLHGQLKHFKNDKPLSELLPPE